MRKLSDSALERAANIAVITAAAVCIGAWLWPGATTSGATTSAPTTSPRYVVGDRVDGVPGIETVTEDRVFLVFVNSLCRYCTESMPFYGRLTARLRGIEGSRRILFVSREPLETLAPYMRSHGLADQLLISLPSTTPFKMTVTPTVLVLNSARRVEHIWVGRLSAEDEEKVLAAIR